MVLSEHSEQVASTHEALTLYRPPWSDLRDRFRRSLIQTKNGVTCGDPELELQWRVTNNHMNKLLDHYFILISGVELSPIESTN